MHIGILKQIIVRELYGQLGNMGKYNNYIHQDQ